jgi:hypothetical protein
MQAADSRIAPAGDDKKNYIDNNDIHTEETP